MHGAIEARGPGNESDLPFETIKSVKDLQARVAEASAAGKTVMLDFYADWCASCKEMERYTFPDPAVKAALANSVLLRADVTWITIGPRTSPLRKLPPCGRGTARRC